MYKINRSTIRFLWSHTNILTILLICSVVLNVFLARKSKRLEDTVAIIESGKYLVPGSSAPPMEVTAMEGKPTTISFGETKSPTVFYVFSTTCGWCERNLENIRSLASGLNAKYRFIGVALDKEIQPVRDYIAKNDLPFPIYYNPSTKAWRNYRLSGTPETIVISPEGTILENWSGAFSGATKKEIETFFQASLPGIKQTSVEESAKTIN